jgi:hypothetical protein
VKRQCFNPYLPSWEYIPDAEPRLFDGRVYIYGSHDRFGSKEYCVNDYVSWSAPEDDLSDWRYEGIIFRKDQTPWNTKNLLYYAPDVVQGTDGKYYLFYSVQNSSIASVAVCDTPAGKFEYLGDVHFPDGRVYGSNPEDWFLFDPAVLVDDDGRIYLYAGSGQPSNGNFGHEIKGLFVMELSSDMLTIIGEPTIILPADFNPKRPNYWEGPSIRHIGKWYYLVYPATDITGLNYAMSLFPDKGFIHKGPIHSSSDIGLNGRKLMNAAYPMGNSHGGMVCVKGQWYIFDHRRTGETTNRQPVAERIEIKEDGSISMVESTSCGLNEGPLRGIGTYPAYIACCLKSSGIFGLHNPMGGPYITQDGPDYEPKEPTDGEVNVDTEANAPKARICGIKKGCVVGYKYFDLTETKHITITARGGDGIMEILGSEDGQSVGEIRISHHWNNMGTDLNTAKLSQKAGCPVGRCPIFLRYKGRGNVELLQFTLS